MDSVSRDEVRLILDVVLLLFRRLTGFAFTERLSRPYYRQKWLQRWPVSETKMDVIMYLTRSMALSAIPL